MREKKNEEAILRSKRAVYSMLHTSLDELVADYLTCNYGKTPSTTTVTELIQWSHKQTTDPDTQELVQKRRQAWFASRGLG